MIRWLLYRFTPYFSGLLLIIGMLILLLASEAGLQLMWRQIEPRLPAGLQIESVSGRLIDRITVNKLHLQTDTSELDIEQAWLRWRPLSLLRGELHVSEIVIAGLELSTSPPAEQDSPSEPLALPALPELPRVRVDRVILRQWRWQGASPSPQGIEQARFRLEADQRQGRLVMSELSLIGHGHWSAQLELAWPDSQLIVRELTVQGASQPDDPKPLYLAATARCDWPALDCEGSLNWSALRWPLADSAWASPIGELSLARRAQSLTLQLDADLNGAQLPPSRLTATLDGADMLDTLQLDLDWQAETPATSNGAPMRVAVDAQIAARAKSWDGTLRLSSLDLSHWLADWPSELNGQLRVQGEMAETLGLRISELAVDGPVKGYSMRLRGDARLQGQDWQIDRLLAQLGDNQVQGHLAHTGQWQGQLDIQLSTLSQLHAQLGGALSGQLELSGQQRWPAATLALTGRDLEIADSSLDALNINGQLSLLTQDLSLKLTGLSRGTQTLDSLDLRLRGTHQDSQLVFKAQAYRLDTHMQMQAQWARDFSQASLRLDEALWNFGVADWTLEQPVRWTWLAAGQDISMDGPLCWRSEKTRQCLQLQKQADQLSADLSLSDYPLQRLERLLPPGARIDGDINLSLAVPASPLDALRSELKLDSSAIRIERHTAEEELELLVLEPGSLSASGQGQDILARWSFPTASSSGLSGALRSSAGNDGLNLEGGLVLELDDLSLLTLLSPEILSASGQLTANLDVSGLLPELDVSGSIELAQMRLSLDTPQIDLDPVSIGLRSQTDGSFSLTGQASSGGGQLNLNGRLDWRKPGFDLRITGQDFLAANSDEALVRVSPDLKLNLDDNLLTLSGTLSVPSALIRPRRLSMGDQAIVPDPDQVIVGQEASARGMRLSSQVDLQLGREVRFEGFGLSTRLDGQLRTRMQPGKVATGVGELSLREGRYKAYGQNLIIDRGRLIFSGGPLDRPGVDLRAYRQATPSVRAGVQVRGSVRAPEFSLYSSPSMRETDQLSYLILGRPAESQNEADDAALNNAALALGLKGGDFLAKRFRSKLGLDEVSIGARPGEETSQASLVLGKYLRPDLYISYGIGLFEPINTFRLRYQLSDKWTLQTETGVEASGDLFYTIER